MRISKELLIRESSRTGFRVEILEKVWHLMNVLEGINSHPFLQERLALKGGTALNLFVFDLPRLSVDIDLNYIGMPDREGMMKERPMVEKDMEAVFQRENLMIRRIPTKYAGGKWQLKYQGVLGNNGNLEVDLNFMFRIPLWDIQKCSSKVIGHHQIHGVRILDFHELAAGKLTALFARNASRDLFDAHHLLTKTQFNLEQLRLAFILYIGMSSIKNSQEISPESLIFDEIDFLNQLLPVLRNTKDEQDHRSWKEIKLHECKQALAALFPFTEQEKEFLRILVEKGEIRASLLTSEHTMQSKIEKLPSLLWRASLVQLSTEQEMKNLLQIEEQLSLGELIGSKDHKHLRGEQLKLFCEKFIKEGKNVNEGTRNGHRPLQMLLRRNETETALLLIEKGADIHSADSSGQTPFQVAVMMNNKKIADLLISRGARKIAPPASGYTNYYNMYLQLPLN
jgi:predicted nucleotidyltransferase component of viral defense system